MIEKLTAKQIKNRLERYQQSPYTHSFTCRVESCPTDLTPIIKHNKVFLKCGVCGHTQNDFTVPEISALDSLELAVTKLDPKKTKKISKYLSKVLRHKPDSIELKLDSQGWACVNELIKKSGVFMTPEIINWVVQNNDKQRFALSKDGRKIRANQGHTIKVDLGLEPSIPPSILYHGTATKNLEQIFKYGLQPCQRTHVHLTENYETAVNTGKRHGTPIVLLIDAESMVKEIESSFFLTENNVWLTETVLPKYLKIEGE